jgi:rSAM/selenodomain-associated transferase 2
LTYLTVVIPTLDEAARIGTRLTELRRVTGVDEVVVCDGGSGDDTCEIVKRSGTARLVHAGRGRARQMNAGAAAAAGDVLLFLHADVSLPSDAAWWVRHTLAQPGVVAGAFRTYHCDDTDRARRPPWLHLADLRSRYTSLPYGDQALFLHATTFHQLGGYADQELMEDLEFAIRLRRTGRIRTARAHVRVSARRFLAHPLRFALIVNSFPALYRLGVSPTRLRRWYSDVR